MRDVMSPLSIPSALFAKRYTVISFHTFVHPWIRYALSDITVSFQVLSKFLTQASTLSFSTLLAHHVIHVAVTCIYRYTYSYIAPQAVYPMHNLPCCCTVLFRTLQMYFTSCLYPEFPIWPLAVLFIHFSNTSCYPRLCLHTRRFRNIKFGSMSGTELTNPIIYSSRSSTVLQ